MDVNWGKYRDDALSAVRNRGVIPISDEITTELSTIVSECALEAMLRRIKRLTVLIDSCGGNTNAGIGIANALSLIAANGVEVTGLVLSRAFSSAFMILQSCQTRVACRGACLMMHWGQTRLQNDELNAIMKGEEDWVLAQIRDSRREMIAIFAKRSGLEEEVLWRMCEQEMWLYPTRAKELNLIDRIEDAGAYEIPAPTDRNSS
ncbi:ATP-dependent Clp protease proteolytic subunit [Patescibacteria group bacterium]|nr:ATP-dependent Clp protease proteolytic subunit [Patescibacteria group bacterium]